MRNIDDTDPGIPNQDVSNHAQVELNECKQQILSLAAEIENLRKRMEREIDNAKSFAIQNFILKLLPAKDSMEKGIELASVDNAIDSEVLLEGMRATLKLYDEVFSAAGLEEINPIGQAFNPEFHEAMAIKKASDVEPNMVLNVFQKGCILNGRLVRPARVEVSSNL